MPLSDSYQPVPTSPSTPYDYFHINSVNLDTDGNLLISGRRTSTVYKVDRQTGNVIWRLGGKESDFTARPRRPVRRPAQRPAGGPEHGPHLRQRSNGGGRPGLPRG